MTSNIENELKAQVSEFAKSDEALKEIISRLSELESLISANQKSRESLDKTTSSISQLASNLGSLLAVSVDSVGNISKISTDIGSTIQRIEAEISAAVSSNLEGATKEIQNAVLNIQAVAEALAKDIDSIANSQKTLSNELNEKIESFTDNFDHIEAALAQELRKSTNKIQLAIGASTIILVVFVLLV
jgi:DNA repair exonuclease SbcCD ATPase subunit